MQLFEVRFQSTFENVIETGMAYVCAEDHHAACDRVGLYLSLVKARTIYNVVAILPNVVQTQRKSVKNPRTPVSSAPPPVPMPTTAPRAAPPTREDPRSEIRDDATVQPLELSVSAVVIGLTEQSALRRIGRALVARADWNPVIDNHIKGLMVDCRPIVEEQRKLKPMEQVELYKGKGFINGRP